MGWYFVWSDGKIICTFNTLLSKREFYLFVSFFNKKILVTKFKASTYFKRVLLQDLKTSSEKDCYGQEQNNASKYLRFPLVRPVHNGHKHSYQNVRNQLVETEMTYSEV